MIVHELLNPPRITNLFEPLNEIKWFDPFHGLDRKKLSQESKEMRIAEKSKSLANRLSKNRYK